jgi:hypothetical protein
VHILFLTAVDPAHSLGGGATASRSIIETLRTAHVGATVDVVPVAEQSPRVPRKLRQAAAIVRSLTSGLPSKCLFDIPDHAKSRIRAVVHASSADLVFFNGIETYPFVGHLNDPKRSVLIAHNLEADLYSAQIRRLRKRPIVGRVFDRDVAKLREIEQRAFREVSRIIALSHDDADTIKRLTGQRPTVMHTSFAYPPFVRSQIRDPKRPLNLTFLARYSWWPNAEAVRWIARDILPKLPRDSVRLHLYGPDAEKFRRHHPMLSIRGQVADLQEVWRETDIFVCPMLSGSGVNVKFLEALYNRQPIIATPITQRGLAPIVDPAVRFLADAQEWVDFLSSDQALELANSTPAETIANRFSREAAMETLTAFLSPDRPPAESHRYYAISYTKGRP